jgi:hypothetical protein
MARRIKNRIAKKRLSEVTATLADGVRIYRRRPRGHDDIESVCRGILGLNISLVLYWRSIVERRGREGDRWLADVEIDDVQELGPSLSIIGHAVWVLTGQGGEVEQRIPFRMELPLEKRRFPYTLLGGT